ncbi:CHS_3a_G0005690.mRNA.1.CDS.1 [Saccharomyces cerevisiae]|nr:hypothetical protein H818_YJM1433C00093 [Saccharomyces cerevisiae YJM1433]GMC27888.1 unnamed protein product [Saccharomyces cerevisiae]CAI4869808.1 CHS_3a_G0005690.mRNA.1.CDS.1 [Saccharomyces cerevisiae]CAI7168103.1 CHS_3a_G0005690.mRNA.1.CDS.1 [Saccharomyces cerevisiae]
MARQKLTFKEQMDGFPWVQLVVVSLVRFSEPIAFSSLFPYVYFMVRDFNIAPNDAQVSKYSGYLSSSFALCQVISAYHWGRFSEKHGRKITLTCGLIGTSVSLLILGFSHNFYQALVARSLMGLLNGNVGVIRTIIGEIATERKHQALAFSTMPLLFQFGAVVGPMIGGFLVFRDGTMNEVPLWFPHFAKRIIRSYPYALPNVVVCMFLMFGLTNATLFLEETHPAFKNRRDYGLEVGDFIKKNIFGIQPKRRPWQKRIQDDSENIHHRNENVNSNRGQDSEEDENSPLVNTTNDDDTESIQSIDPILTRRQSVGLIRTYSLHEPTDAVHANIDTAPDGCKESSIFHHVFHTKVFYPISVNFIMALHLIVYNEFLPVFLAYDLAVDPENPKKLASKFPWKISGGIGYEPEQTGTLLSTTGIFGCFVVIFIFPIVDRNFDCLTIFRTLVKLYPIMYVMVPYVVFLQNERIPSWCTVVYLYIITGIKTFCGALTSPQIMLLIHNSSPLSCRSVINGATISISASARFIGPLVWGYIMSWSQQNDVAWVSWWSLSLFCMVALYQSYKIAPIDDNENELHGQGNEDTYNSQSQSSDLRMAHRSSLSSLSNQRCTT